MNRAQPTFVRADVLAVCLRSKLIWLSEASHTGCAAFVSTAKGPSLEGPMAARSKTKAKAS